MPFTLLLAAAAQIAGGSAALPQNAQRPPWIRQQTFVAPSGEPFHAPADSPYPSAAWFAQANTNHDGKLTLPEFTADFLRFTASLDLNHDGVIDSQEIENYENQVAPEVHSHSWGGGRDGGQSEETGQGEHRHGGGGGGHGSWGGGGHRGGGGGEGEGGGVSRSHGSGGHDDYASHPQGAARFDLLGMPEPVAAMDVNLNGRITRQEVIDAAEQRFEFLDTEHRGYLQLDNLPPTFAQQRKGHGHRSERRQDVPIPLDDK